MENVTFEGSLKGRANLKGMKPIKLAKDNLKFFAKFKASFIHRKMKAIFDAYKEGSYDYEEMKSDISKVKSLIPSLDPEKALKKGADDWNYESSYSDLLDQILYIEHCVTLDYEIERMKDKNTYSFSKDSSEKVTKSLQELYNGHHIKDAEKYAAAIKGNLSVAEISKKFQDEESKDRLLLNVNVVLEKEAALSSEYHKLEEAYKNHTLTMEMIHNFEYFLNVLGPIEKKIEKISDMRTEVNQMTKQIKQIEEANKDLIEKLNEEFESVKNNPTLESIKSFIEHNKNAGNLCPNLEHEVYQIGIDLSKKEADRLTEKYSNGTLTLEDLYKYKNDYEMFTLHQTGFKTEIDKLITTLQKENDEKLWKSLKEKTVITDQDIATFKNQVSPEFYQSHKDEIEKMIIDQNRKRKEEKAEASYQFLLEKQKNSKLSQQDIDDFKKLYLNEDFYEKYKDGISNMEQSLKPPVENKEQAPKAQTEKDQTQSNGREAFFTDYIKFLKNYQPAVKRGLSEDVLKIFHKNCDNKIENIDDAFKNGWISEEEKTKFQDNVKKIRSTIDLKTLHNSKSWNSFKSLAENSNYSVDSKLKELEKTLLEEDSLDLDNMIVQTQNALHNQGKKTEVKPEPVVHSTSGTYEKKPEIKTESDMYFVNDLYRRLQEIDAYVKPGMNREDKEVAEEKLSGLERRLQNLIAQKEINENTEQTVRNRIGETKANIDQYGKIYMKDSYVERCYSQIDNLDGEWNKLENEIQALKNYPDKDNSFRVFELQNRLNQVIKEREFIQKKIDAYYRRKEEKQYYENSPIVDYNEQYSSEEKHTKGFSAGLKQLGKQGTKERRQEEANEYYEHERSALINIMAQLATGDAKTIEESLATRKKIYEHNKMFLSKEQKAVLEGSMNAIENMLAPMKPKQAEEYTKTR